MFSEVVKKQKKKQYSFIFLSSRAKSLGYFTGREKALRCGKPEFSFFCGRTWYIGRFSDRLALETNMRDIGDKKKEIAFVSNCLHGEFCWSFSIQRRGREVRT